MRQLSIQTNFTAGEVSPRLYGRVDVTRYANAAKRCRNATVCVQGGARRRDGLRFVYEASPKMTRDASGNPLIRLIPFVFSRDETYVIELGHLYARFYQQGRIISKSDSDPTPYEIVTTIPGSALASLSYTQSADTMFIAHPEFKPIEIVRYGQRDWRASDVVFDVMPFDILTDAEGKAYKNDGWLKPSDMGPVGKVITLTLHDTDDDKSSFTGGGFTAAGLKAGDYIRVNSGLVKINTVTDKATATGELRALMYAADIASNLDWTINRTIWSDYTRDGNNQITGGFGWPACVAMHQQRLLFAGTRANPQTIWGSAVRVYRSFELGYLDNSAYSFTISSDTVNQITALFSLNCLVALTHGGEFLITGSNNFISPTNVQIKAPSTYGSSNVRPVRVGTQLIYIQRAGCKVLGLEYDPESTSAYAVSDLSLLAEHLTKTGIVDMSYQQEPESVLNLVAGDGSLITVTINKESDVVGWTHNQTGENDRFLNVASVPYPAGTDETYFAIERTINGKQVVYIEHFLAGVFTDSCLTNTSVSGTDTWQALEHLEGMEVDVVADGVPQPRLTVSNGKIVLSRKAHNIEIGIPYTTTVQLLRPELQTAQGSAQGMKTSVNRVILRLLETVGATVNGQPLAFRHFSPGVMGINGPKPIEPFTGDMSYPIIGTDNTEITIEQIDPLPFHLLAVIRSLTINP